MKLSEWLIAATKDDAGQISAMRLMNVLGVGLILYVWAFASLFRGEICEFPRSVVEVLAALLMGKVIQAGVDNHIGNK